jgi:hypothetical protein
LYYSLSIASRICKGVLLFRQIVSVFDLSRYVTERYKAQCYV